MSVSIVIHGYYGFKNIGDELILRKIIGDIRLLYPDAYPVVLSGDPQYTHSAHGIKAVDRFNINDVIEAVRNCDVLILGAGGLFNDHWPLVIKDVFSNFGTGIAYYAVPPLIAKIFGKPVFYWSHGVGPFFTDEAVKLTKWAYSLADFITLRDEYSYGLLTSMDIPEEKICVDFDPVFKLDVRAFVNEDAISQLNIPDNRLIIGVNLRPWKDKDQEIIEQLGESLTEMYIRDKNILFLLIPFDFSSNIASDFRILKNLPERLPEGSFMTIDEDKCSTELLLSAISMTHGVIGMRLHFLLSALKLGKPTIALNYDTKVKEMFRRLRLNDLCVGMDLSEIRGVHRKISEVIVQRDRFFDISKTIESIEYMTPLRFKEFVSGEVHKASDNFSERDDSQIQSIVLKEVFTEVSRIRSRIERIQFELSDKDRIISAKDEIIFDKERIITDKDEIISEFNSRFSQVSTELDLIYKSRTWRIGQTYGRLFGVEAKWRKKLSILFGKGFSHTKEQYTVKSDSKRSEIEEMSHAIKQLRDFLNSHSGEREIYFIFSPAPFVNCGGQRGVRFAQELSLSNKPVVYVRCLQNHLKNETNRIGKNIIEYPLNWFYPVSQEIISSPLLQNKKKIIIFQVSFYNAFEMVSYANAYGWITVYDIIDDWEEFYNEKFIVEYDKETENYLAGNSDVLVTVNQSLKDKFNKFGEVFLIPNGYSPGLLKDRTPRALRKGGITLGFFGHLHPARFNWDLLINAAEKQKEWIFYIIGFGEPGGLALPENIVLIGQVEPSDLSGYAENWDVAIIPYQNNELCKKLNPVKIFEYLYFNLPIVATGCEDVKNYPYSFYANNEDEFISFIKEAATIRFEKEKVSDLLQEATWENRLRQLLSIVQKRDDFKEFCIRG